MRGTPLALLLLAFVALLPPAQAANFGGHVGLAHAIWEDPYFRAGALIPDLDHFLPPGEPRTDDATFALGLAKRAWNGSRNAWRFATGWYEHVDQDLQFADSVDRIVKAHPSYSETDVRLAFDYWTLRKHPFPTDFDWILSDEEVLGLIQGGLVGTDLAGVRSAVNQLLHSTNLSNPGLALQIQAANTYGAFYGDRARTMESEYDRYIRLVTASYVPVLPRIDLALRTIQGIAARGGAPLNLRSILEDAVRLETIRPVGWMADEVETMGEFIAKLPSSGMPLRARLLLEMRARSIIALLS